MDAIVKVAGVLVDNLKIDEYHTIRENLGLTSGSHSIALHYHLMRDLYPQLWRAADRGLASTAGPLVQIVCDQVRTIGNYLDRWRLIHLGLPRNNLGGFGTGTRSLTGAPDAVSLVSRMRERGRELKSSGPSHQAIHATDWDADSLALAPIERLLLEAVARRTKQAIPDVQNRSGYFAQTSSFKAPEERIVDSESTVVR